MERFDPKFVVNEVTIRLGSVHCKGVFMGPDGEIKTDARKPVYLSALAIAQPLQESAILKIQEKEESGGMPLSESDQNEIMNGLVAADPLYKSVHEFLDALGVELGKHTGVKCECPL